MIHANSIAWLQCKISNSFITVKYTSLVCMKLLRVFFASAYWLRMLLGAKIGEETGRHKSSPPSDFSPLYGRILTIFTSLERQFMMHTIFWYRKSLKLPFAMRIDFRNTLWWSIFSTKRWLVKVFLRINIQWIINYLFPFLMMYGWNWSQIGWEIVGRRG